MSITIKWSAEDVQVVRPSLTLKQAGALLEEIGQSLKDSSVEAGWDILRDLIELREGESNE
jgi:hypothetical protein